MAMGMMTGEHRWRRLQRVVGLIVGGVLLVAALVVAARGIDWHVLRQASPWQLVALAVAVVGNLLATAALFWVITRSFDTRPQVGPGRMLALIAASGLLNYLPLPRLGMVGRAAYLKAKHDLPVRQSVLILAIVFGLALVVLGAAAVVMLTVAGEWRWVTGALVLIALLLVTEPVSRWLLRRPVVWAWTWVPLRTVDMLFSAFRLWVAFRVVGVEIGYGEAVVMGAAGLFVRIAGLTPNGIGLSEWVVAMLGAALSPVNTATAAAGALVDRAVEVIVVSAAGLTGAWWLRR